MKNVFYIIALAFVGAALVTGCQKSETTSTPSTPSTNAMPAAPSTNAMAH